MGLEQLFNSENLDVESIEKEYMKQLQMKK